MTAWVDAFATARPDRCRSLLPASLSVACDNRGDVSLHASADGVHLSIVGPGSTAVECAPNLVEGRPTGCDGPRPLWAVERVRLTAVGPVTVMSPAAVPAADDPALTLALDRLQSAGASLGPVVIELPGSAESFARASVGVADPGTGAVTILPGPRIVVNPVMRTAADDVRAHLYAHELSHVARRSLGWPPGWVWLAEGWAEHDAAPLSATVVRASDEHLARALAAAVPRALPADADFGTSGDVETAYALARVAVEVLVARVGPRTAAEATDAWTRGTPSPVALADLTDWWLTELARR